MVLLVDDLPNLSHGETGRIFTNAIRQHLNTPRLSTPPLVVIISDTSITPGSNGFEESLSGRSGGFSNGEDRGTNVHTLLPPDILNHPQPACQTPSIVGKPKKNLLPSALSSRQLLGSRDESSVIFHSLGKILYNKRWGDDAKEDAKDKRIRAPEPDPLPAFWSIYSRRQRKTDMDRLYSDLSVSVEQFIVYLHQNYPPFTDSIDEASFFLEYLSLSDSTIVLKDQTRYSQALTTGFYHSTSPHAPSSSVCPRPSLGELRSSPNPLFGVISGNSTRTPLSPIPHATSTACSLSFDRGKEQTPVKATKVLSSIPHSPRLLQIIYANDELIDRFSTYVFPNARDTQTEALLSDDDALDEAPSRSQDPLSTLFVQDHQTRPSTAYLEVGLLARK
ncbi:hypothetical protein KEM48_012482 [Puccinia striiformis f. sp. tritici PST-130]|nr:hypothetical protein KEM48_012482 [Puccinia striiformis f. sp. tritici PST-130]